MNVRKSSGLVHTKGRGGILNLKANKKPSSILRSEINFTEILGKKLLVTDFDIPVVKNAKVEFWVKYFTGKGRKSFARYMKRLGKLSPLILPILQEYGLPNDLMYMAMIESGFSNKAKSPAGAVGLWQFVQSTGRSYGLEKSWWVDERKDPVKSSRAAAKHLSDLYKSFEDWELVAAAYNAGKGRVTRGIKRHKTKNYWKLSRRRAFRRETIEYVPKMMAAAIIAKNPSVFGFSLPSPDPYWLYTSEVLVQKPTALRTLARTAGVSISELRRLNPELRRWSTPPNNYQLRVPNLETARKVTKLIVKSSARYKSFVQYKVRKGDSVYRIARQYGVPAKLITSLNGISKPRSLRVGTVLAIPSDPNQKTKKLKIARKIAKTPAKKDMPHVLHVVRKNDTLYDLSRRYKTTVSNIKRWNLIVYHRRIQPGQLLRIYLR